jgi:hypothetical protein
MDISFEVIRGTGLSEESTLKAYLPVRMQKKDIHTPINILTPESAVSPIDKLRKDSALSPVHSEKPTLFFRVTGIVRFWKGLDLYHEITLKMAFQY